MTLGMSGTSRSWVVVHALRPRPARPQSRPCLRLLAPYAVAQVACLTAIGDLLGMTAGEPAGALDRRCDTLTANRAAEPCNPLARWSHSNIGRRARAELCHAFRCQRLSDAPATRRRQKSPVAALPLLRLRCTLDWREQLIEKIDRHRGPALGDVQAAQEIERGGQPLAAR